MRRSKLDDPILAPPPAPLTLRNARHDLYQRLPAVEDELCDLMALESHSALTARLERREPQGAVVRAEALAYFLREWHRAGNIGARDWLVERTMKRIDRFIHAHLYGLSDVHEGDAHGDVVERVFRAMLNLEESRGEYYQVRFWNAVQRRCSDQYDHYHARELAEREHRAGDPRDRDDGQGEDPVNQIADETADVGDRVIDRDEARRALQHLRERVPPDHLEAYILRKVQGWPIEGTPGPTLSEHYGKTPRTINNWIRAVDAAVAALREGTT